MPIYFRSTPINEPLTFHSIGNHWIQEESIRPKGYPLYHYLQTEKGCGQIIVRGKRHLLHKGEGVLIAPHIAHSYTRKGKEWFTSFATFTGTIENSIDKMLGNRQLIFIEKEQGQQIAALISESVEMHAKSPLDTQSISTKCYHLLLHFASKPHTYNLIDEPLYQKYIAPVIQEIETHYNTLLTCQELSNLVYITPQYLSRLFGRFLGCSTYEYLTTYRINQAKELLLTHSDWTVLEIAQSVGFLDASHFIASFKKVTGITPLKFRRLN